jgi:propanol-preferring alcohol dehydrogenase
MKTMILEWLSPMDTKPLRLIDRPDPTPGSGEVLIKVAACGVCRSSLHMIEGDWASKGLPAKLPIVPGHEIAGSVESFPLERAEEALRRLKCDPFEARAVVVP